MSRLKNLTKIIMNTKTTVNNSGPLNLVRALILAKNNFYKQSIPINFLFFCFCLFAKNLFYL